MTESTKVTMEQIRERMRGTLTDEEIDRLFETWKALDASVKAGDPGLPNMRMIQDLRAKAVGKVENSVNSHKPILDDLMDFSEAGSLGRWQLNLDRYAKQIRGNYPTAAEILGSICHEMMAARSALSLRKLGDIVDTYVAIRSEAWLERADQLLGDVWKALSELYQTYHKVTGPVHCAWTESGINPEFKEKLNALLAAYDAWLD